nr:hypothetical protein [Rhizobium leguminosarum]
MIDNDHKDRCSLKLRSRRRQGISSCSTDTPDNSKSNGAQKLNSTLVMINLLGAVALLLFGLALVKDGAIRALGAKLRTGLASGTKGSLRAFESGFVATVALQSSTATALKNNLPSDTWSG